MRLFKKTYGVHHSGCPYFDITIIPKIIWIRYYYATTKNLIFYFMINIRRSENESNIN